MKKLIVIPARGGSKAIPGKNIYPINGKPLLAYTLECVQSASLIDADVVVSTDSEKIKEVALSFNDVYVVDRPSEISGDKARTEDALIHAVDCMQKMKGITYDVVLTLQPTSPLRNYQTLISFIEAYEKSYPEYDAQLSLNENRSDFWTEVDQGHFERLYKDAPRRRQDRKPLFVENSAYYITDLNVLRQTMSVLGTHANGFLISDIEAVDINEPIDIIIAESILKKMTVR